MRHVAIALSLGLSACSPSSGADRGADGGPACADPPWVLFALSPDVIYAIHPDGTGGHDVALPHPKTLAPSVSGDGTAILTMSPDGMDAYAYRFGATSDSDVASPPGEGGYALGGGSLSHDGALVVMLVNGQSLEVGPALGSSSFSQTFVVSDNAAYSPIFTPDGARLVFGTETSLMSTTPSGAAPQTLVSGVASKTEVAASFSPDGSSLAVFIACSAEAPAIRVYDYASLPGACTDGAVLVSLTEGEGSGLSWGPTNLVAYSDGRDVWVVPAAGGSPTALTGAVTAGGGSATSPTWAPGCTPL
jgi:hypothetical protein